MEIIFVRHTSVDVPRGICYGRTDVATSDSFEQEAEVVSESLLKEGRPEVVYTSPLSRCTKLAEYCGYPHALRDKRLLELDFGEWEMKNFDIIDDPRLQEWYDDYINVAPTGGESFTGQIARVKDFIDELRGMSISRAIVFTHGGVLLCAMVIAGIVDIKKAMGSIPPYGSVLRITFP